MARTGRPPKPTALKKLQGTLQKCRQNKNEWQPPSGAPAMPESMPVVAQEEWRKAVDLLVPAGILTQADGRVLESYCRSVARARQAERVIEDEGLTVETKAGTMAHPAVGIARQAWEAANRYGERLGLDPSSRARLQAPAQKSSEDPDEEFLSRRRGLQVVKGGSGG